MCDDSKISSLESITWDSLSADLKINFKINEAYQISNKILSLENDLSLVNGSTSHSYNQLMTESLRREIERSLKTFTPREADVIRLYFGLNGDHPMTLEEIGERFDLTRERVRQIKEKAIRRLKHTSRSRILKGYLG